MHEIATTRNKVLKCDSIRETHWWSAQVDAAGDGLVGGERQRC